MSAAIEVKVPDIGDFAEVEVIEVLVAAGDTIAPEQSLITVESDKASMEIPSPAGGRVTQVVVKVGDKVAEGSVLMLVEASEAAAQSPGDSSAPAPSGPASSAPAASTPGASPAGTAARSSSTSRVATPAASSSTSGHESQSASGAAHAGAPPASQRAAPPPIDKSIKADIECEMLVLGAGPGGYSAAFRSADLGLDTVLVERYVTLGGVCLNVGCIPSKALLHLAAVADEAASLAAHGITFGKPQIDLDKIRHHKEQVVGKLTGGLSGMAKARKVRTVRGIGTFIDANHLEVAVTAGSGQEPNGEKQVIRFRQAIIAAGSQSVRLPFLPEDDRIVDSTGALALRSIPKRLLVIGGGIIGLEMGTVYSTLGTRLDVVEMLDGLMPGADRDLVKVWQKFNAHRFDNVMLGTRTVRAEALPEGIKVWFEGPQAPAEPQVYDLVLAAVGRSPNGARIGADKAGVAVGERGFIAVDNQMRTNQPHIYAIGDVVGQPMLAHKAVHEAHVAAETASGINRFFDAKVVPSVAYTDPEIAWVGVTEDQAKAAGMKIGKSVFPWAASGRAIANGRDEGFTKLLFDEQTHRIVGAAIVGTHAGDMIGELCLAIEMGAEPADIARTIHPHPTLGESIGMAAEVFEGVCTDLPPPRKARQTG